MTEYDKTFKYQAPAHQSPVQIHRSDRAFAIFVDGLLLLTGYLDRAVQLRVQIEEQTTADPKLLRLGLMHLAESLLLEADAPCKALNLGRASEFFRAHELGRFFPWEGDELRIDRSRLMQCPYLWLWKESSHCKPEVWTESKGRAHPEREAHPSGVLYRRFVPKVGKTLSFEHLDLDRHLDIFHYWHNLPRVYKFWELNQSREELKAHLEKLLADPRCIPTIYAVDGVPAGYFEFYWTAEDRLAPYYPYEAWDRALHFLIGSNRHLGEDLFRACIEAMTHFLYLDDPRTRRIMAEPRADNIALLHYLESFPNWKKLYEFDFPHKRAALLESKREVFFRMEDEA